MLIDTVQLASMVTSTHEYALRVLTHSTHYLQILVDNEFDQTNSDRNNCDSCICEWIINIMNIQKKILASDKIDSQHVLVSRGYHTHELYWELYLSGSQE